MTAEQLLISKVNLAVYILRDMNEATKKEILQKYDMLASTSFGSGNDVVLNNLSSYEILLDKTLFVAMIRSTQKLELNNYTNLSNMIKVLEKKYGDTSADKVISSLYDTLSKVVADLGGNITQTASPSDVTSALELFGLAVSDAVEEDEILDQLNDEDNIPDEIGLFDNAEDTEEEELTDADFMVADEEEDNNSDEEDNSSNEVVEEHTELDPKTDLVQKLAHSTLSGIVQKKVDDLRKVLSAIYEPSYSSIPYTGLLIDNGDDSPLITFSLDDARFRTIVDEGLSSDYTLTKAIIDAVPSLKDIITPTNRESIVPAFEQFMNTKGICTDLHLQYLSGSIPYGDKSGFGIRKWVEQKRLKDTNSVSFDDWNQKFNYGRDKLSKYKDASLWIEWGLKKIIYNAIAEDIMNNNKNMSIEKSEGSTLYKVPMSYIAHAEHIINVIDKNVRNVIVVSERVKDNKTGGLISEEVRISAGLKIDKDHVISVITKALNSGIANSVVVKQKSPKSYEENNVLILDIQYDVAKANKSDIFAYEIVDSLLDSGGELSWSHAMIGKNEDGTYLYWDDFMDPQKASPFKRCYTIYGASRSGKGVMTSTLVASALSSGKQVFYTDGKPENGPCLGRVAWEQGREAYVFDGQPQGSVPFVGFMEDYTFGQRTADEVLGFIKQVPKELGENPDYFESQEKQRLFLGVMRYLRSMYLCSEVIEGRARGTVDKSVWQVWIFDEIQNMAKNETEVRKLFAKYLRKKFNKSLKQNPSLAEQCAFDFSAKGFADTIDPNNEKFDAGVNYIYRWNEWAEKIKTNIAKAAVISLGKADMNLIFIFQTSDWIKEMMRVTVLGNVVSRLESTKIVGRGSLCDGQGAYGTANTIKSDWYTSKINTEQGGWWAISEGADLRSSSVKVFKPYKIWTIPLDGDRISENKPDEERKYVAGYINYVANRLGFNAADILNSAYEFANNALVSLDLANGAENIKQFIYNCADFNAKDIDVSYDTLIQSTIEESAANGEASDKVEDVEESIYVDVDIDEPLQGSTGTTQSEQDEQNEAIEKTIEPEVVTRAKMEAKKRALKLLSTTSLMNANYDDDTLGLYFDKFIMRNIENNKFDYSDRAPRSNTGLKMASLILSSFHYCSAVREIYNINDYKNYLTQLISSGRDPMNKATLALGMLNDYDESSLEYDKMPSEDRMRQYILQYSNISTMTNTQNSSAEQEIIFDEPAMERANFNNFEERQMEQEQEVRNYSACEMERPYQGQSSVYQDGSGNIILNRRNGQKVTAVNPDMFIDVDVPKYSTVEKFKKKLFESRNGTAYEFKKRWDIVLDFLEKRYKNKSMVKEVMIVDNHITVNNSCEIDLDNALGGDYNITLDDIICIKLLLKRFPLIKTLLLDSVAARHLFIEYGLTDATVSDIFKKNNNLYALGLLNYGDATPQWFTRDNYNQKRKEMAEYIQVQKQRMKLEKSCAYNNPRPQDKNPGYFKHVFDNSKALTGKSFSHAKDNIFNNKNPRIIRAMSWSLVGAVTIGIGSIFGVMGYAKSLFER